MILNNIYNLESNRGNRVPNQVVTVSGNSELERETNFYSYSSFIIGINNKDKIISIGNDYNYSITTSRYRNKFLHEQGLYQIETLEGLNKAIEQGYIDYNGNSYKVTRINA